MADAIVVLGCRTRAGLTRRVDVGVRLFQSGGAPVLLLSGGGAGPVAEAEIMCRMALARGVPEAALLIEPDSRDTVGNARRSARLPFGVAGQRPGAPAAGRAPVPLAGLHVAAWAAPGPPSTRWEIGPAIRECAALPRSLARAVFLRRRG